MRHISYSVDLAYNLALVWSNKTTIVTFMTYHHITDMSQLKQYIVCPYSPEMKQHKPLQFQSEFQIR